MINGRRTDLNCTNCYQNFIAELDFGLDGNHIICCPYCGHEHCRVIRGGEVTEDRWTSSLGRHDVDGSHVWKCDGEPMTTSGVGSFVREMWLNRLDLQL